MPFGDPQKSFVCSLALQYRIRGQQCISISLSPRPPIEVSIDSSPKLIFNTTLIFFCHYREGKDYIMSGPLVKGLAGIDPSVTYLSECTPKLCSLHYAVLRYIPTYAGNITVTSFFGAFLVAQIIFWFFHRTNSFTVAVCCGLILEIVGYCARVQMHFVLFTSGPFLM